MSLIDFSKADPNQIALRCKRCGAQFSFGEQLRRYADRNRDLPKGKIYIECPTCHLGEIVPDLRHPITGVLPAKPMPAFIRKMIKRYYKRLRRQAH